MRIHEFGNREHPVILLLPGTICYWKGNFGKVIDNLARDFYVAAAAYTGFDEADTENYVFYAKKMGEKYLERYRNISGIQSYMNRICAMKNCLACIRKNGASSSERSVCNIRQI